jgi:hypothetical protein
VNVPKDLVNHVVFVVDRSSSIADQHLTDRVVSVFDDQVRHLVQLSKTHDQETRVSVFLFSNDTECVVWDKDVLRLPSLKDRYEPHGRTALIDATIVALDDLGQVPCKHGDHAFLVYVITDGYENESVNVSETLAQRIGRLGENWTVAALVPSNESKRAAVSWGFPAENVQVWEVSGRGLDAAEKKVSSATSSFFVGRAAGQRGSKSLFTPDTSKLDQKTVNTTLRRLTPAQYQIHEAREDAEIADFVEARTGLPYVRGRSYYLLRKRETVQPDKEIVLVHKKTAVAYHGPEIRAMLGLPGHEVRINPADAPDYWVYVQSNSVNRKVGLADSVLTRL